MPRKTFASSAYWLPIHEIARLWADETAESATVIERALVEWYAEFVSTDPEALEDTDPVWDADVLRWLEDYLEFDRDSPMCRKHLAEYCRQTEASKPRFWFGEESGSIPTEADIPVRAPRPKGRPSWRKDYQALFDTCLRAGQIDLNSTLQQAAYVLHDRNQSAKPRTIERYVSGAFRRAKAGGKNEKP